MPCGQHAEDDRRQQRHDRGEGQDRRAHRHIVQPRQPLRQPFQQRAHAECDDDQADDGAQRCEHEAFGEQLTDDAPASRADGGAHGELALPHHPLRQQQAADVRARDQQHEAGGALQNLERRPEIAADHRLVERHDANAPALVLLRLLPEAAGELIGRSLRLLQRDAILQAGHDVAISGRAAATATRGSQRYEVVGRCVCEDEARRHHAEDRARCVIATEVGHAQPLADHVGRPVEPTLPQVVADEHHLLGIAVIFCLGEPAPQHGLHTERLHGVIGEHLAFEPLRSCGQCILGVGHVSRDTDVAARRGEERVLRGEVHADRRVEATPLVGPLRRRRPQLHQSIGFRVGKRPKQDGVHEAEDQRVGADAERKRKDDDEGGARLPRHDAGRIAYVLQDLTQEGHRPHREPPRLDMDAPAMSIAVPPDSGAIRDFVVSGCPLLGQSGVESGRDCRPAH